MRVRNLAYASIIASVPFFAGSASAESTSAEPVLNTGASRSGCSYSTSMHGM